MSDTPADPDSVEGIRRAVGLVTARMQTTAGLMSVDGLIALIDAEVAENGDREVVSSLASLCEILLGVLSMKTQIPRDELLRRAGATLGDWDA